MNTKVANHPNFGKANIRVRISIMVRELSRVRTFVQALLFTGETEKARQARQKAEAARKSRKDDDSDGIAYILHIHYLVFLVVLQNLDIKCA